jgi:hypothetical protein
VFNEHWRGISGSAVFAGAEVVAELVRDGPRTLLWEAVWIPVFDVTTFIRTGVELLVMSDSDADGQLDALAPALNVPRKDITIKPPPGWCDYGHPDLFPRPPTRT